MILPDYAREMAAYNQWQNETLYDLCAGIGEAERTRDRGMFFRSIHDTLDHILLIDRLILRYVDDGNPPQDLSLDRVYDDFDELRTARQALDAELRARAESMTAEWLSEPMTFWSDRLGRERTLPRGFMITQMFNHQTHHRSQVTSQLHTLGIDYGNTDLPTNPKSQF